MESTDSSSGSQQQQQQQQQLLQQPQLPPGFRFHPTDEELVVHYLKRKATSSPLPVTIIAEVDLYKFDPWELPGKATYGEQEWYFFSPRDRKYPNGARPNRAATSGYWKATGTDKPILTTGGTRQKVGVKKALVFYGGKPPKGIKTNWIMHEYRLADSSPSSSTSTTSFKPPNINNSKTSLRLDDWVLCRIYKKNKSSNYSNGNNGNIINPQRAAEGEEAEDSFDEMVTPQLLLNPIRHPALLQRAPTNFMALLDNDGNFFEGLLTTTDQEGRVTNSVNPMNNYNQLENAARSHLPKCSLTSPFWTEAGTIAALLPPKQFHGCNTGNLSTNHSSSNGGHPVATTTVLSQQIPHSAPYPRQTTILGSVGDATSRALFRQPYQLSSVNWSS